MNEKIHIIEDDRKAIEVESQMLESFGYEVSSLSKPTEKLIGSILRQKKPDLVIMDIKLGKDELDGIQLAEISHHSHSIPVVYITGYTDDMLLERAKKTEPYGYLVKPFSDRELNPKNSRIFRVGVKRSRVQGIEGEIKKTVD